MVLLPGGNVLKNQSNKNLVIMLSVIASVVTVAMSPWWNEDSLIVPKLSLLFVSSLFLFPQIIKELITNLEIFKNKIFQSVLFLLVLIIIQIILVSLASVTPLEQQFYGRFGRGLGVATELSLIICIMLSIISIRLKTIKFIIYGLGFSCIVSSCYSILQFFGIDFFDWQTKTNGIIGTLGNPNFQSSFAAIALVPTLIIFGYIRKNYFLAVLVAFVFIFTIYITESIQGYIASIIAVGVFLVIFTWYKSKKVFVSLILISMILIYLVLQGMLNKGPLATLLYKYSVQSRWEFYRNSVSVIKDNFFFGVGFDSLGDFYLKYKDLETTLGVNEFTDNAHNMYLQYAVVAGVPYAIWHILLAIIVLFSFIKFLRAKKNFDALATAVFCAWICFQAQALISPTNISMLTWNAVLSGTIISLAINIEDESNFSPTTKKTRKLKPQIFSLFTLIIALFLMVPYFNSDKKMQDALTIGNANLAMQAANSFPKSVVRYERLISTLMESKLETQALETSRELVKFNPHAPSGWGYILINSKATREEREDARKILMDLDPQNLSVRNFKIP